jgi:hypothetical protein
VIELTSTFIRAKCRSYHFGSAANNPKNVHIGESAVRVIPWSRVEIVNELPATFDFANAKLVRDKEGGIVLRDRRNQDCTIVPAYTKTY